MANTLRGIVIILIGFAVFAAGIYLMVRPQSALLIRETITYPCWVVLVGMGIVALGTTLLSGGLDDGSQFQREIGIPQNDWIELQVQRPLRSVFRGKLAGMLPLTAGALFVAAYYLVRASPYDWHGCGLIAVCVAAIIWQGWRVRAPWIILRSVKDARLWIPAAPIRRGEKFSVKAQVQTRRSTKHLSVFLEIACVNHYLASKSPGSCYEATRNLWISEHTLASQPKMKPNDLLHATAEFLAPLDQAESNDSLEPKDKDGWPYCIWELRVSLWTGGAHQTQVFILRVQ